MCAAIIPNGSAPRSPRASATTAVDGGQGARRSRAGRPARQHAEDRSRQGARRARPSRAAARRRCRRSACASPSAPTGAAPALAAEPAYVKGLVEVQDEGSQLAALLSGAEPGMQVLDLCAGAGGKTLALAAMMENQGQIYATDDDGRRLAPIFARLERSGARNVQVRAPKGARDVLSDLAGRCDLVFVDAPCTRLGRLAAQPRRQMAHPARRAGAAHQGPDRNARKRRAFRQAGRAARLRHLLGAEGRERGPRRRLPRDATPISCRSTRRTWRAAAGLPALAAQRFDAGRRPAAQPACAPRTDGFYVAALTRDAELPLWSAREMLSRRPRAPSATRRRGRLA